MKAIVFLVNVLTALIAGSAFCDYVAVNPVNVLKHIDGGNGRSTADLVSYLSRRLEIVLHKDVFLFVIVVSNKSKPFEDEYSYPASYATCFSYSFSK